MVIVEVLLGLLNPRWDILKPTESTPYYYQTWIPVNNLIALLDTSIRNGTASAPFPYFLSTCQLRVRGKPELGEFKYMDILDMDIGDNKSQIDALANYFRSEKALSTKNYMVWYTGQKGFRVARCHSSIETIKLYTIDPNSASHVVRYSETLPDQWVTNEIQWKYMMDKYLDAAPWHRNRGFKFDVHPHPKTGKYAKLIYNKGLVCPEDYSTVSTVMEILRFWRETYGLLKNRLETMLEDPEMIRQMKLVNPNPPLAVPVQPPLKFNSHAIGSSTDMCWKSKIPDSLKAFFLGKKPYYFREAHNDFFIFGNPPLEKCRVHNRRHSSNDKAYFVWKKGSNFITAHCHSSSPSEYSQGHKIFFQDAYVTSNAEIVDTKFLSDNSFLKDLVLKEHTSFHILKQRYVSDLIEFDSRFNDGCRINNLPFTLIVKAGMGCGKTVGLKRLLDKIIIQTPGKVRILAISTRRTCTGFLSDNFGCIPYINLSSDVVNLQNLQSYDRICISMESLHKIARSHNGVPYVPKFNVVILDEVETILSLFTSATMESKRDNFILLADICKASDRVFAMDALLNEKSMGFFYDIGLIKHSINYSILFNVYSMDETCYVIYRETSFLDWKMEFINSICRGKRVALVSSKKNAINVLFLEAQYECIKRLGYNPFDSAREKPKIALIITGASPDNVKATAITCNTWEHLDFIGISPAITVGNSDMSEWDEQFCFFGNNITASTALQMSGRFRKVRSSKRHVLLVDPSDNAPKPSPSLLKKRNIREVYTRQEQAVLEEAKYLIREKVLVVENHAIPDLISIQRPVRALQNLVERCKEEELRSRNSIYSEFIKHLDYANILYQILSIHNQDEDSKKANRAALNSLRKESMIIKDTIKDKKETPQGDTKSSEMIRHTASEKLVMLGAPFGNKKLIEESISVDEFVEFQKTHSLVKHEYIYHYLFVEYKDCTEFEFIRYFENLKNKPNEFAIPLHMFMALVNEVFETEYFKTRKHYFSVRESSKCKEFVVAISDFYCSSAKQDLWQVHTNLYPKGGKVPVDYKDRVTLFLESYCSFFGFYFQRVDTRKHRKLYREKLNSGPNFSEAQNEIPQPYYSSEERNPKTQRKLHKNDTLYSIDKVKNDNVDILSKFMHSENRDEGLLPERYRFRKYFLSPKNSSN